MTTSKFARFRDLHMPAFLLNEQMRMPAGMIHLSNEIIYGGRLADGRGTALLENLTGQDLKTYINEMYPSIKPEPKDLAYNIFCHAKVRG